MMRYGIAAVLLLALAGSAAAQTTIVSDSFTDASGTALTAHAPDVNLLGRPWTLAMGAAPTISNGRASASAPSIALIDGSTPDATISTWWYAGSSPNLTAGLVFRATDTRNFFVFRMTFDRLVLYRVVNDQWTQLWLQYLPGGAPLGAHHLQVVLSGTTITLNWDGGAQTFTTGDWFNVNARLAGVEWTVHDTTSTYDAFTISGVFAPAPATTAVSPASATVLFEATQNLTATGFDASGNPVSGLAFDWTTSNPALATVAPTGLNTAMVTGRGVGNVTITAAPVRGPAATAAITAAPGAVIVADNFTGTDGMALTSHEPDVNEMHVPWTLSGGAASLLTNRLQHAATSGLRSSTAAPRTRP